MSMLEVFKWFVILFILILIYGNWRRKKIMKNSNIPGPYALPLLGHVMEGLLIPKTKRLQAIREYFNHYGPVILFWGFNMPFIHIGDVEYAEAILSSTIHIDKSFLYSFLKPWLGTGLLTSSGEKWHKRRKILTPTFHFSFLNMYIDIFISNSKILMKRLEFQVSSEQFDIVPYLSACTLDIICEAAMGVKMNVQQGTSNEYIYSVHTITEMVTNRIMNPVLYPDFIHRRSNNYRQEQTSLQFLHKMSLNVIQKRMAKRKLKLDSEDNVNTPNSDGAEVGEKPKKAFLDLLLDISEREKDGFSIQDIREEVDTFMFEGHDTTSSALGWVIFAVGHHPDVQVKIYEELDDVFGNSDRPPNENDLTRLKYLECVIKETMRLFPPVPILSRKLNADVKIGDYTMPADATVLIHLHQIHRSPKYFPNPNKFDPSNFAADRCRQQHPYSYTPFSAGPRNCIGQKFAMIEEKIILSLFFRKFRVESIEKMENILIAPDTILRPVKGIYVRLEKRERNPATY